MDSPIEKLHIGTSGWSYPDWQPGFYPAGLPGDQQLSYYSQRFQTVEINASFYRLPTEKQVATWYHAVPPGFVFAIKASRYLTHMKKLKDPGPSLQQFCERMKPLWEKTGPILFQLPPGWHFNPDRFEGFVTALPHGYRYAFEFRDPTWLTAWTYDLLKRHDLGLCLYDFNGFQPPSLITADFVYIRLHGPKRPYEGHYSPKSLTSWHNDIINWLNESREVFCYFDNTAEGCAIQDAQALKQLWSPGIKTG